MKLHFSVRIEIGVNPYVLVSAERAEALQFGWRRPMPVEVQINGQPEPPWHINLMPQGGGSFFLYLAGVVRQASGTGVGDVVAVDAGFDGTYRGGPLDRPRLEGREVSNYQKRPLYRVVFLD